MEVTRCDNCAKEKKSNHFDKEGWFQLTIPFEEKNHIPTTKMLDFCSKECLKKMVANPLFPEHA